MEVAEAVALSLAFTGEEEVGVVILHQQHFLGCLLLVEEVEGEATSDSKVVAVEVD